MFEATEREVEGRVTYDQRDGSFATEKCTECGSTLYLSPVNESTYYGDR